MDEIQTQLLRDLVREYAKTKTQTQISKETGVAQASLSRFLKGEQGKFSGDNLLNLFRLVGVRVIFPGQKPEDSAQLQPMSCDKCAKLEMQVIELKARNEAFLEAISAQAAAQSKVEIEQRPSLYALAKGDAS